MNWTADINDTIKDFPLVDRHLKVSESCQFGGACAIQEGADALAEAIEAFLKRPILEITGLAQGGIVEFREFYLVGEGCCDVPIYPPHIEYWHGLSGTQKIEFPQTEYHYHYDPADARAYPEALLRAIAQMGKNRL